VLMNVFHGSDVFEGNVGAGFARAICGDGFVKNVQFFDSAG
jgi:hypothetical protein